MYSLAIVIYTNNVKNIFSFKQVKYITSREHQQINLLLCKGQFFHVWSYSNLYRHVEKYKQSQSDYFIIQFKYRIFYKSDALVYFPLHFIKNITKTFNKINLIAFLTTLKCMFH